MNRYELGDDWECECGRTHDLTGVYLAAHWDVEMIHKCDCGRKHSITAGIIELIRQKED